MQKTSCKSLLVA